MDFSSGALRLTVQKEGKPSFAWVYVNEAGTENKVTSADTSADNPLTLHLMPGTYDIVVVDDRVSPPQRVAFPEVTITPASTIEKTADFTEGFLSVEVLVNGEKGTGHLYVYAAGTDNSVDTGDTSVDNPMVFALNAGAYDLKIIYPDATPEKETVLRDIQVVNGQTVVKRVEF